MLRLAGLHSKRVHRTMIRRSNHNIWASCHVAVTYIGDNGPQSPNTGTQTLKSVPRGRI
jgi:hypothetical protein